MSTPAITPTEEQPFDPAKFVEDRNRAERERASPKPVQTQQRTPIVPTAEPERPKPGAPADPDAEPLKWSRSQIREMNKLREAKARAEGEAAALRSLVGREPASSATKAKDPNAEPARADFANDQEYLKAVAKYEANQAVSQTTANREVYDEIRSRVQAADSLQVEHMKLIPDWEEISKDFGELIYPDGDTTTPYLVGVSDMRAFVLEHFVKHPKDWDKLVSLKTPEEKHTYFARLEGRCETEYNKRVQAAQAAKEPEAPTKDRKDAAPGSPRQTAQNGGSPVRLPKPSSEVAAKGGSAPPAEPAIGSPEWMAARNRRQYGQRH